MPTGWAVEYLVNRSRRFCLVALDDPQAALKVAMKATGSSNVQFRSQVSEDHRTMEKMTIGQVLLLGARSQRGRPTLPPAQEQNFESARHVFNAEKQFYLESSFA